MMAEDCGRAWYLIRYTDGNAINGDAYAFHFYPFQVVDPYPLFSSPSCFDHFSAYRRVCRVCPFADVSPPYPCATGVWHGDSCVGCPPLPHFYLFSSSFLRYPPPHSQ